jgi:hypothetical protein
MSQVMLSNPIELAIHKYLNSITAKDTVLSKKVLKSIVKDIEVALNKQFVEKKDQDFTLRMSNIGRPYCQLWFDKNKPESALSPSANFIIMMLIGDILEAVFKGLLTASGVSYKNGEQVELDLGDGCKIPGTPDSFGYIAQLAGYAEATNTKPNGWWVINKGTGEFKHVDSPNLNTKDVLQKTKQLHKELQENKFRRCFEDEPETYRKKPSGNRKLGKECSWCAYRHACWPGLKEMPSKVSQAENPPMVCYTEVR